LEEKEQDKLPEVDVPHSFTTNCRMLSLDDKVEKKRETCEQRQCIQHQNPLYYNTIFYPNLIIKTLKIIVQIT